MPAFISSISCCRGPLTLGGSFSMTPSIFRIFAESFVNICDVPGNSIFKEGSMKSCSEDVIENGLERKKRIVSLVDTMRTIIVGIELKVGLNKVMPGLYLIKFKKCLKS